MRNNNTSDIAANLMLAINNKILRAIPEAEIEGSIDEADRMKAPFPCC